MFTLSLTVDNLRELKISLGNKWQLEGVQVEAHIQEAHGQHSKDLLLAAACASEATQLLGMLTLRVEVSAKHTALFSELYPPFWNF